MNRAMYVTAAAIFASSTTIACDDRKDSEQSEHVQFCRTTLHAVETLSGMLTRGDAEEQRVMLDRHLKDAVYYGATSLSRCTSLPAPSSMCLRTDYACFARHLDIIANAMKNYR